MLAPNEKVEPAGVGFGGGTEGLAKKSGTLGAAVLSALRTLVVAGLSALEGAGKIRVGAGRAGTDGVEDEGAPA